MKTKTTLKLVKTLIALNDNIVDIRPSPNTLAPAPKENNDAPNDAALKEFYDRLNYF